MIRRFYSPCLRLCLGKTICKKPLLPNITKKDIIIKSRKNMTKQFILTNEQRKYLGLNPIEDHWEVMDIKGTLYYFDGDLDYEGNLKLAKEK